MYVSLVRDGGSQSHLPATFQDGHGHSNHVQSLAYFPPQCTASIAAPGLGNTPLPNFPPAVGTKDAEIMAASAADRPITRSLFHSWKGSEHSLTCLACCQECTLLYNCLLSSFVLCAEGKMRLFVFDLDRFTFTLIGG